MKIRGFEIVRDDARKFTDQAIQLPTRGSKIAAGYDFYTPQSFTIPAGKTFVVWTDVKSYMQEGEVLKLYVRSSIGIKRGLVLANGTGIIDADYYGNPSNDGNIGIALFNCRDQEVTIEAGERIAQGLFQSFLVADNGNTDSERAGGMGSTGTK
jgi:dUTP pyrophosphatase